MNALLSGLETLGGLALFIGSTLRAALRPRLDAFELWRILHRVGVRSLPIVIITAVFAGAIAALQVGTYVVKFRAYEVVGWGFGYAVFRELGPLLIGLMFSGRVGANHTAELGTMRVTEQIDALRALAIDPIHYLILPRVLSMIVMMTLLNAVGDLFALLGGMATAWGLIHVDPWVFWNSFIEYVKLGDFLNGMIKANAFGAAIGLLSCGFGMQVTGGAPGVGRAVNASVMASAVAIFFLDWLITAVLR
ncbi:ABC transporter permease [Myxococcota bacterium]|nr:ABC transporter permease [Myxococcota bacterium]MBU1430176.1 ABC transporter permease [Myxococcota bacterium]MBU1900069.1 ABC transporter permease [Myxococcota bacterium]